MQTSNKKLLIFDYCSAHSTPGVIEELKNKNIDFLFIPKRMTSILQPLDRMVNCPLKKFIKNKYTDFYFI